MTNVFHPRPTGTNAQRAASITKTWQEQVADMATPEEATLIARRLAGMRVRVEHTCPECGESFTAIKKAVYCSNRCRQKAKYKRKK